MLWATLLILFSTTTDASMLCDTRELVRALVVPDPEYSQYLKHLEKNTHPEIKTLFEMVNYTGNRYVTPTDQLLIQKIYANAALNEGQQAEQAFQVYFEARIKDLTETEQAKLQQTLRNHRIEFTDYKINGTAHPVSGAVSLRIPESYSDTLVKYFMLTHELEHTIQFAKLGRHLPENVLPKFGFNTFKPKLNRRLEYETFLENWGAMKVEAEFINAVPASAKKLLADRLAQEENKTLQKIGNWVFAEPQPSVESYVAKQWANGRNMRKKFLWKNLRIKVVQNLPFYTVYNGLKFGALYGGKTALKSYCDQQRTKPSYVRVHNPTDAILCKD